jgi:hypothetical protein
LNFFHIAKRIAQHCCADQLVEVFGGPSPRYSGQGCGPSKIGRASLVRPFTHSHIPFPLSSNIHCFINGLPTVGVKAARFSGVM